MKMKPIYNKFTDEIVNDYIEYMKYNDLPSQISIDSLDLPHIIGKIQHQQKEIKRLNNILNELEDTLINKIRQIDERIKKDKIKPYGIEFELNECAKNRYREMLDKIKELKGEDNE